MLAPTMRNSSPKSSSLVPFLRERIKKSITRSTNATHLSTNEFLFNKSYGVGNVGPGYTPPAVLFAAQLDLAAKDEGAIGVSKAFSSSSESPVYEETSGGIDSALTTVIAAPTNKLKLFKRQSILDSEKCPKYQPERAGRLSIYTPGMGWGGAMPLNSSVRHGHG